MKRYPTLNEIEFGCQLSHLGIKAMHGDEEAQAEFERMLKDPRAKNPYCIEVAQKYADMKRAPEPPKLPSRPIPFLWKVGAAMVTLAIGAFVLRPEEQVQIPEAQPVTYVLEPEHYKVVKSDQKEQYEAPKIYKLGKVNSLDEFLDEQRKK